MADREQSATGVGSDFGKSGSKQGSSEFDQPEAGTPRTGYGSAPRGQAFTFDAPKGTGGTGVGSSGAH